MVKAKDIDPAIQDVIAALNSSGYKTVSSCAGHGDEPEGDILFARSYPHRKIREILEEFGLEVLEIKDFKNPWYPKPRTLATFVALGGPSMGIPTSEPFPKRLPKKVEAIKYFEQQGASRPEAERLAKLTGYR